MLKRALLAAFAFAALSFGVEARADNQQVCVASAAAYGTGDNMSIPSLPCHPVEVLTLYTPSAANTTTSPTITETGYDRKNVVGPNGSAISIGSIPANSVIVLHQHNGQWYLASGNGGPPGIVGQSIAPSNVSLATNLTLSGSSFVGSQTALSWDGTVNGTTTNTGGWQSYWYWHAVDSAAGSGNTPISGLDVRLQLTGTQGLRNAIQSYISVDTQPNVGDTSLQNYVSMSSLGYSQASAKSGLSGGANFTGYAGSLWGTNPNVWTASGAVHWLGLYGGEFDTHIETGSDVAERYGLFVVSSQSILGAIDDAALAFTGLNTNGIQFGGVRHSWTANGSFITAVAQTQGGSSTPSAAYGVNFTGATFSTAAWASTGATIDGSGNVTGLTFTPTGTTCSGSTGYFYNITGSVVGVCESGTAVAAFRGSAGSFFNRTTAINTNDQLASTAAVAGRSGMTLLNTSSGTTATTDIELGNSASISEAKITLNGGGFSGGIGANGLAIGVAAAGATIELGTGSEVLRTGSSGMFTANGTVATALSSLGPTNSHTTVQEWFTVTDASGNVRYIPAF